MKKILKKLKQIFNRSMEHKLTYSEVKNIMKNNNNSILIDVRSMQEFNEGHLLDAINLSVYDLGKQINNTAKDKDDIIILYCQTERRSIKAKKILEKMGYINIYILKDGLDGVS